jgi:Flp pilus assembly protein TadD
LVLLLAAGCGSAGGAKTLTAGGAPVALPAAKPEARVHFEEGLRLMEDPAQSEQAAAAFQRATKADRTLFEAWHDLGVVQARQGRWEDAAIAFGKALEIQPGSRRSMLALAEAYLNGRHPSDAVGLLEPHIPSESKDAREEASVVEMRLLFVRALREAGKYQRALDEVEKVLARAGRSARGFNALGLVYYRMDRPALAEAALRRAAELDPKSAEVWNNLGLVALARGRDREAFENFDKAGQLDGDFIEARLNKAAVLLDCGDYTRAFSELEKAQRVRSIKPELLPELLVSLGVAARGVGKNEEARRAYEGALAVAPDLPAAHFNLGVLFMDFLPDKAKAREHLRLYRKVAPSADPRQKEAELRLKELR